MNRKPFFLLTIIFCFVSCKVEDKDIESSFLKDAMEHLSFDTGKNWIVILPGLGCTGCIQEAEFFVKENIENENIYFVLTKIESLKILSKKIGFDIKEYDNVFLDWENDFVIPTNNSIYPCIIKLDESKQLLLHEFQSPKNPNAFNKLSQKVIP